MKNTIVLLCSLVFNVSFSQNGTVETKNQKFIPGVENTFVYQSPNGLVVPENSKVIIVYEGFIKKTLPLQKKQGNFEFNIKLPDTIRFIQVAISDSKNNVIDSNNEKSYVVYLKNETPEELEKAKLVQLGMFRFTNYFLKTNFTTKQIADEYETLFQQNPKLKENSTAYLEYLYVLNGENKEKTTPKLRLLAEKLEKKNDEKSLTMAYDIYQNIKTATIKQEALKNRVLKKYPNGTFAKRSFMMQFYENQNKTESYILETAKKYTTKFKDDSSDSKDQFYFQLVTLYLKNKDTINLDKYEKLTTDKVRLGYFYNDQAWQLSGQDLTTPASDIEFAETISRKSLDFVKERMNSPKENDDADQLQGNYNMFADTFALILFKQGKYDLAFEFQDAISKLDGLDTGGKERYSGYAEKVKGLEFTKNYIEEQLNAGIDSKILLNQLKAIYEKLNLSETEYEKIKQNALSIINKKANDEIAKSLSGKKAIDFNLKNLEGKSIKLSDYIGKVVVLDFWATWCGPCRASFPKMQDLISKYKNEAVEFLFIDTWEKGEPKDIQGKVSKFIADNKYPFNVLFDFNDDIVTQYDIKGIPSKIVIDKEGKITSSNYYMEQEGLVLLIDENLKK